MESANTHFYTLFLLILLLLGLAMDVTGLCIVFLQCQWLLYVNIVLTEQSMLSVWSDTDLDITRQRSLYISTSTTPSSLHIINRLTPLPELTNLSHQDTRRFRNETTFSLAPTSWCAVPCRVELEEYEHVCGCASLFVI